MTPLTKNIERKAPFTIRGRNLVINLEVMGIRLRRFGTQDEYFVPWLKLWRWAETENIVIK